MRIDAGAASRFTNPLAFEYSFDDIGNRKTAVTGGDQWGANKRYQNYSANLLNQYEQRTVPGYLELLRAATNTATVTVNNLLASRQGEYLSEPVRANQSTERAILVFPGLWDVWYPSYPSSCPVA